MDELEEMCRREHGPLVGMLGLYCGDRYVAEDLAQEALIRLCRDWRKVRKLDAPQHWLRRVAINLAHSHYRRKIVERRALSRSHSSQSQDADSDLETLDLLNNLPHRQKTAVILHYYLDMTVPDVAQVMETPEGTVKTLIHRATQTLTKDPAVVEARGGS